MSMHRHVTEWEIGFWWEEYSGRIPWRDSVKLRVFAVFRRTVRGITYCQHPPACGGAGFGGKGSDLRRKKSREQSLQMASSLSPNQSGGGVQQLLRD